jgi:hypothetical protein
MRDRLKSGRDRKVNVLTLASIVIGTGSGVVGTARQFDKHLVKPGDWVSMVAGAGGVALSILALRQHGGEGSLGPTPNMLATIFGRPPDARSVYPPDVWRCLNTAPANNPSVRVHWKNELIAEWVRLGRIGPPVAPESQKKIDQLTSRAAQPERLSIASLTDRSTMLADVSAHVSLMNRDLRDLMTAISIPPAR